MSRQELALLAVAVTWGGTFLVGHEAMRHSGPLFFVGLRFLLAGALSLLAFRRAMPGLTRRELLGGVAIGVTILLGNAPQTYGLQTISSSTSAFLTALYVPLVPIMQWAVFRRKPSLSAWLGISLAFCGLLCLAGPDALGVGLGRGEVATILSAIAIAAEVLLIGHFAPGADARRLAVVQLIAGGAMSLMCMPVVGEGFPAFSWIWLAAAAGLAVASVFIQLTMNWAQKSVSATKATVIYASEPVWGGVLGRMAGERLPPLALVGAALIVAGVLASELKLGVLRRKRAVAA